MKTLLNQLPPEKLIRYYEKGFGMGDIISLGNIRDGFVEYDYFSLKEELLYRLEKLRSIEENNYLKL